MSASSFERTADGFFVVQEQRLTDVERRIGRRTASSSGPATRGTTAERDATYGVPATTAERVDLANRRVTWTSIERGWDEMYYTTSGSAGLTAPGLVSGVASGWYPVGPGGPRMFLAPSAPQSLVQDQVFINWAAPGTTYSHRRGGPGFLTLSGGIVRPKIAGRYRVSARLAVPNASGGFGVALYLTQYDVAGNAGAILDQFTLTLHPSLGSMLALACDALLSIDESIRVRVAAGSTTYAPGASGNPSAGSYLIEYVGPPLVSN